ncbi:hypothetical protein CHLRE_01g052400v5 [Chlamydomonas reinhardtii]|nr:uncharacterized protein CHLRE_01g052400v5 [Chlamydomonas reinhardtii]PNW88965.1 hypothetical protein CHLRE_01g052400v5 [Chlamydomonas reinhardtii]
MASSMLHSSARCAAFKAGPLRSPQFALRPRATVSLSAVKSSSEASSSSACSTSERQAHPLARLEVATVASLLASGALAGSCLAADSPENAEQTVQLAALAANILRPAFNIFTLLYIIRVPMTWYPEIDGKKMPWALAYAPTEPVLSVARKVVPLLSGVDVSPIVMIAFITFSNEILLGPQGLLTLIQQRGGL